MKETIKRIIKFYFKAFSIGMAVVNLINLIKDYIDSRERSESYIWR